MRYVFIVNPVSGKADPSGTLVPQITSAAEKMGIDCEILLTEYAGHAKKLAEEQARAPGDVRLYACGGDGTFNEVIRGAYGYGNAAVGCIPCGSGNDFVRNFGEREPFLDLERMMRGTVMDIDLIQTEKGIATTICSAGLDAQVAYGIPKFRRLPFCGGTMSYNLSIVQAICGPLGHRLRVQADDEVITGNFLMLAICNGKAYGGGYVAAPEADMQDGLLDLVLIRKIGRLAVARVIGDYKKGAHIQNGQVAPSFQKIALFRRVRSVQVEVLDGRPTVVTEDGECEERMGVSARVCPLAARIILPAGD